MFWQAVYTVEVKINGNFGNYGLDLQQKECRVSVTLHGSQFHPDMEVRLAPLSDQRQGASNSDEYK